MRKNVAEVREIRYTRKGIGSSYLFRVDDETVGAKPVRQWMMIAPLGDRLYAARQLRTLHQPLVQAELLREDPLRRGRAPDLHLRQAGYTEGRGMHFDPMSRNIHIHC